MHECATGGFLRWSNSGIWKDKWVLGISYWNFRESSFFCRESWSEGSIFLKVKICKFWSCERKLKLQVMELVETLNLLNSTGVVKQRLTNWSKLSFEGGIGDLKMWIDSGISEPKWTGIWGFIIVSTVSSRSWSCHLSGLKMELQIWRYELFLG